MNKKFNKFDELYELNGRAVIDGRAAQFNDPGIVEDEPLRYPDRARWMSNNGFRQRWLGIGRRHAEAINAGRRGDLAAVIAHVTKLGGVTQKMSISRSAIKLAARLPHDVAYYKIEGRTVYIPNLSWGFSGRRQIAKITWTPLF